MKKSRKKGVKKSGEGGDKTPPFLLSKIARRTFTERKESKSYIGIGHKQMIANRTQ